ncbi:MAG: hypothetical protein D6724_08770 [Armatimonadetes bacterium]|nr:MAG: hypothetical protein D6724_08770 [Armatimonadota bacterium]
MVSFDPPGNTQTATGHLYLPIIGTASCYVTVTNGGETLFEGWVTGECAAVGGPLTFDVYGGIEPPPRDGWPGTPSFDEYDLTKPWYLEYFGYDPRNVVAFHPNGPGQPAQRGLVCVALTQPQGPNYSTTYDWQLAGPIVVIEPSDPSDLPTSAQIRIGATDGSAEGAIKPRVKYIFAWDGVVYGPFDDDSEQTPPPPERLQAGVNHYAFAAHKPADTKTLGFYHDPAWGGQNPDGTYYYRDDWLMVLVDNRNQHMPWVWVQEVFHKPDGSSYSQRELPPQFRVDGPGVWWTTSGKGTGLFWTTPEEVWGGFSDTLSFDGMLVYYPRFWNGQEQPPFWNLWHYYYAGTKDPFWPRPLTGGGILVGSWNIRIWSNSTDHVKGN